MASKDPKDSPEEWRTTISVPMDAFDYEGDMDEILITRDEIKAAVKEGVLEALEEFSNMWRGADSDGTRKR